MASTYWTRPSFDFGGFSIEVSVEQDAQRQAVVTESEGFLPGNGAVDLRVHWRSAPLDLSSTSFSGEFGKRQYGPWPDGIAIQHRAVAAIATAEEIQLGGTDDDPAALADDYGTVFGAAITYWLAHRGRFPIHAAAVGQGDDALLLLGRPGAGKSTAAWGAHRAGCEFLADDTAFIRRTEAGSLEVSGLHKRVAIPGELLPTIPEGASQDMFTGEGGGSRDRWALLPEMLTPGWRRVVGVVTPTHGTAPEGELVETGRMDLMRLAVGVYYAADSQDQLSAWLPHAGMIARLPAWELRHTPEVDRRLEVAAQWIGVAFDRALAAAPTSEG